MFVRRVRGLLVAPREGTGGITIQHGAGGGLGVCVFDRRGSAAGRVECDPCSPHDEGVAIGWVLYFAMQSGAAVRRMSGRNEVERWDQRYRLGIPYRELSVARWIAVLRRAQWTVRQPQRAVEVQRSDTLVLAGEDGVEVARDGVRFSIPPEALIGISTSRAQGRLTLLTRDGPRAVPVPETAGSPDVAQALKHLITSAVLGVA